MNRDETQWRDQCLHRQYRAWDDIESPRKVHEEPSVWPSLIVAVIAVGVLAWVAITWGS